MASEAVVREFVVFEFVMFGFVMFDFVIGEFVVLGENSACGGGRTRGLGLSVKG